MRAHLQVCPECREEYQTLRALVVPLWDEPSVEVLNAAKAFLSAGVARVQQLTTAITMRLAKGKLEITTGSPALQPLRLTPALAMRHRGIVAEDAAQCLPLPDEEHGIQVNVTLKASERGSAEVTVAVVELQHAAPIEGASVVLLEQNAGRESLLEAHPTNEVGAVHFSLSPGQYTIQVSHAQCVWRFPLGFEQVRR